MSREVLLVCAACAAGCAVVLGWPGRRRDPASGPGRLRGWWQRSGDLLRPGRPPPIAEFLSALAAELSAGQPTGAALLAAVRDLDRAPCPQAVVAVTGGGDVAAALRRDAEARGGYPLRGLAACWEVAERSGAGLSVAVGRLAESVRAATEADAQLRAELAAVRTSAWILAALPGLGLAMGHWIGAQPLTWLLGGWVGRVVAIVGICLQLVGGTWLHLMVSRTRARL